MDNGTGPKDTRASSAWAYLNGTQVLFTEDLNKNVEHVTRQVTLQSGENALEFRIASTPGSILKFRIRKEAPVMTVTAPPEDACFNVFPTVTGTTDDASMTVTANDVAGTVTGSTWQVASVPIAPESQTAPVRVIGRDWCGNTTTIDFTLRYDITAPAIAFGGFTDGEYRSGDVAPTYSVTDINLTSESNTLTRTLDSLEETVPFTSGQTLVAEGDYVLTVTGEDCPGNASSETRRFTIDKTPPEILIAGVTDGEFTNQDRTPTFTVTDRNPDTQSHRLTLDGVEVPFVSGQTLTAEGDYVLVVTATDKASNSTTVTRSWNIDKTPPEVTISGVTEGEFTNQNRTPTFTVTDRNLASQSHALTLDGVAQAFVSGQMLSAEGDYVLSVTGVDRAGNATTVVRSWNIDKTPPVVSITGVTDGEYTNQDRTPAFSVTDRNLASQSHRLELDGVAQTFASGQTLSADGDYTLSVTGTDKAGNSTTVTRTWNIDKTPPTVEIAGVTEDEFTNQNRTPTFTVTDRNLASQSHTLTLDGQGKAWESGQTLTAEGDYVLTVTGTDRAGNTTTLIRRWNIDKTPPAVAIAGVTDGEYTNQDRTPTFTVTDRNLASQSHELTLDAATVSFASGQTLTAEGDYVLSVTGVDKAGNSTTEARRWNIDKTAPTVELAGATEGEHTNQDRRPTATISDRNLASQSTTLTRDGQAVPFTSGQLVSDDGAYVLSATAADRAGNTTTRTLSWTIDKTAPVVAIAGVIDGEYTNQDRSPSFTVTDRNLASQSHTLTHDSSAVAFTSGQTLTAEGDYVLSVTGVDRAGNSTTVIRRWNIDKTAPAVSIAGVTDGEYTNQNRTPTFSVTDRNLASQSHGLTRDDLVVAFESGQTLSAEGDYVLVVRGQDRAGNSTTETRRWNIDKTIPDITIAGVTNGEYTNQNRTPTFTVTDRNLASQSHTLTLDAAATTFASGQTLTAEGDYVLTVQAADRAGNTASKTVAWNIDKTAPSVTMAGVTDGEYTNQNRAPSVTITDRNLASQNKKAFAGAARARRRA